MAICYSQTEKMASKSPQNSSMLEIAAILWRQIAAKIACVNGPLNFLLAPHECVLKFRVNFLDVLRRFETKNSQISKEMLVYKIQ